MAEHSPEFPIAAHVESISTQSAADRAAITRALLVRSWPGGSSDRIERVALGWLRRWRPRTPVPSPLRCECRHGRCQVCN
jgi:hypothetical protein